MLQLLEWRGFGFGFAGVAFQRDKQRSDDTGQRGVHAGFQDKHPEQQPDQNIGRGLSDIAAIQHRESEDAQRAEQEVHARQLAAVKQGNHDNRQQIVNDRQRQQEQFQGRRHPGAEQ